MNHHISFGRSLGNALLSAGVITLVWGCSGSSGNGPQQSSSTGSTSNTGGTTHASTTSAATGGATSVGGSSNNSNTPTGGVASQGGTSSSNSHSGGASTGDSGGATTANGGTLGTGGESTTSSTSATSSNSGGAATGGAQATGGDAGTGGTSVTSSSSGGAATGGAQATGGKSVGATGGVTNASGGMQTTGGTSSIGGTSANSSSTGGATTGGTTAGGGGSCKFTVSSALASASNPQSPTTVGIVKWSVTGITPTGANINFGPDSTYGMTAPVDLAASNYQTPLLGMKPAKTYHFKIAVSDGSSTCTSDDYTITTGPKTSSVSVSSFVIKNTSAYKSGFIVSSYWNGTGASVPFILDGDGDIVWWYTGGPSNGIARARMSADAKNLWMVVPAMGEPTHMYIQRVTMDTLSGQTYNATTASHDIAAVSGSLMAYIDYASNTCSKGGSGIIEIDPAGNLNPVVDARSFMSSTTGCHGNAVRYSAKNDYYTYSDYTTDIYILDRSGNLKWKLSDKVSGGKTSWGGVSHGHQLLDNSILIFANAGGGSNASAAIEFGLDGSLIRKFASGGFTSNFGDVQRLPGGNTLITYSNGSIIQQVDSNDKVTLEITGTGSFGYAEWRDSLYGAPLDINQ